MPIVNDCCEARKLCCSFFDLDTAIDADSIKHFLQRQTSPCTNVDHSFYGEISLWLSLCGSLAGEKLLDSTLGSLCSADNDCLWGKRKVSGS